MPVTTQLPEYRLCLLILAERVEERQGGLELSFRLSCTSTILEFRNISGGNLTFFNVSARDDALIVILQSGSFTHSFIGTHEGAFLLHDVFYTCHSLLVLSCEACCEPEALLGARPVGRIAPHNMLWDGWHLGGEDTLILKVARAVRTGRGSGRCCPSRCGPSRKSGCARCLGRSRFHG